VLTGLAGTLLGPAGLTEHATSFTRPDLLRALCEQLPAGAPVSHDSLQGLADLMLTHPDVVTVAPRPAAFESAGADGETAVARWTTRELLAVEAHALTTAAALRGTPDRAVNPGVVERLVEQTHLTGEQAGMVTDLLAAGGRLRVVVGPAGSGKTAALAAATRAWTHQRRAVHGCALSALAARGLQDATGVPSTSVAALLTQLDREPHALAPGSVLVVDEVGMVGTRPLDRLLTHAHTRGAAVVLVGDPRQLPEIGAGGLFACLADDAGTTVMTANQRQAVEWEQTALTRLRAGRVAAALDAYHAHRRIHIQPDHQRLQAAVAQDYLAWTHHLTTTTGGGRVLVVAASRRHAAQLNGVIRDRLAVRGTLTGPGVDCTPADGDSDGALELRAGDTVMVTRNDHTRGLLNGEQARVTAVDPDQHRVVLAVSGRRELSVDASWAGEHLGYGYALTVHKAQGQTVDVTLVAGSTALTRETTYTALSRGRTANHLYLAPEAPVDRPDHAAQAWLADHALADAAARLRASRQHTLATDLHTPAPRRADPGQAIGY